jgi:hypothetical protein
MPSDKPASKPTVVEERKALPKFEPFDLSYVPVKAESLLAIRPSAIFRRGDMKRHGEGLQELIRSFLSGEANVQMPIKLESIEQFVLGQTLPPRAKGKGRGNDLEPYCLSVRFSEDVDWQELVKGLPRDLAKTPADWAKVAFEGRTYYKPRDPEAQPADTATDYLCFFLPDARTVVMADEETLRALIRQPAKGLPELARGSGWEEISRGLIALASAHGGPEDTLDDFSGALMEMFMDLLPLQDLLPLRSNNPRRLFCGIGGDEACQFRISEDLGGAKEASAAALELIGKLTETRLMLGVESSDLEAQSDKVNRFMFRWMQEMSRNCRVRSSGRTVELVTGCKVRLTELVELFSPILDVKTVGGDLEKTGPGQGRKETKR